MEWCQAHVRAQLNVETVFFLPKRQEMVDGFTGIQESESLPSPLSQLTRVWVERIRDHKAFHLTVADSWARPTLSPASHPAVFLPVPSPPPSCPASSGPHRCLFHILSLSRAHLSGDLRPGLVSLISCLGFSNSLHLASRPLLQTPQARAPETSPNFTQSHLRRG